MPQAGLGEVLAYLRRTCAAKAMRDLNDGELLELFVADREDAAFSALVRRHGPMVMGVCRRVLNDSHSAEDAFQATFMVLVRRIASVSRHKPLSNWLYGVAQRIALKARMQTAARRSRERRAESMPRTEPLDELTWQELRSVLDEEIGRLAENLRAPIVLCYFEGKSHDEAARQLGWPRRSLTSRLTKAREQLRQQLSLRGITLSAAALATVLSEKTAGAAVGAMLTINTVKAAVSIAARKAVAGSVLSAQAIALAEEGMKATIGMSGKVIVMMLTLGLTIGGVGLAGYGGWNKHGTDVPTEMNVSKASHAVDTAVAHAGQKKDGPAVDLYGDPIPEGALARLGTVRWRHAGNLLGVHFADNDKTLVSNGGLGYSVGIWDAATGRLKHKIIGRNLCLHIAVSPNGKIIVTDQLDLIDVKTGQEIHRLAPRPDGLHVLAFSPDSKIVAAAEYLVQPPKITLWDVDTGKELRKIEGHPENVYDLAFSTDSRVLAIGGDHRAIRFWDVATGKLTRQLDTPGKQVMLVKYSPDGKMLASIDHEGVISLWDLAANKVLRTLNNEKGESYRLAFSPDGKQLASLDHGQKIRLWDPQTGKEIRQWPAKITGQLSFSSDGKSLASGVWTPNCTIRRWDTATGKEIEPATGQTGPVIALQFSPDGKSLTSRGKDNIVVEWDLATLRQRRSIFSDSSELNSKYSYWNVFDYSPATNLVAIGRAFLRGRAWPHKDEVKPEITVPLWNTNTDKASHELVGHTEQPERIEFSSDGKNLASSAKDGVRLWDVTTGKQVHHWPGQTQPNCFAPDSKKLIIGGPDKMLRFWDVDSKKEVLAWDSGRKTHKDFCFSADGRLIASVNNEVMTVWAVASGEETRKIGKSTPNASIQAGALSPTGRVAAIADQESHKRPNGEYELMSTIRLVETITGDEIRRMVVPHTVLYSLAFSPDGRLLASDGGDSTILFWDMTSHAIPGQLGKYIERSAPTAQDLATLWAELGSDASKAEKALWALAFSPKESTPFLKERLKYGPAADAKEVAKIITSLGSDTFADRQLAAQSLEKLGETAEAAVRAHLEGKITLEVRQRLQQFLETRNKEVIRKLRAIEVLELIGTTEAQQLLESLAKDAPNPRVAEGAAAALARLSKRV